jgi:DegV family protein with EDD domain
MSKKIRFVTDSVCDIPADMVRKWNIAVIPCFVNYDGLSFKDDGIELKREDFYRKLPAMKSMPTTAAMAPGLAEEVITRAYNESDHVFIITTPAKLSGIYNAMRLGSSKLDQQRITLIDSCEVAAETGDVQKTHNAIMKVREGLRLYAALATMEFLRRSGRVSWATALVAGTLLQIKPVLLVKDGDVSRVAAIRTFSKATEKLIELTREHAPLDKLAIIHTNNVEGAQELQKQLGDLAPRDTLIADVGPTLGVHIGPGAVGVVPVSASWKE